MKKTTTGKEPVTVTAPGFARFCEYVNRTQLVGSSGWVHGRESQCLYLYGLHTAVMERLALHAEEGADVELLYAEVFNYGGDGWYSEDRIAALELVLAYAEIRGAVRSAPGDAKPAGGEEEGGGGSLSVAKRGEGEVKRGRVLYFITGITPRARVSKGVKRDAPVPGGKARPADVDAVHVYMLEVLNAPGPEVSNSRLRNTAAREALKFWDHYEAVGWVTGGRTPKAVKDWRAAVRQWLRRLTEFSSFPTSPSTSSLSYGHRPTAARANIDYSTPYDAEHPD